MAKFGLARIQGSASMPGSLLLAIITVTPTAIVLTVLLF